MLRPKALVEQLPGLLAPVYAGGDEKELGVLVITKSMWTGQGSDLPRRSPKKGVAGPGPLLLFVSLHLHLARAFWLCIGRCTGFTGTCSVLYPVWEN